MINKNDEHEENNIRETQIKLTVENRLNSSNMLERKECRYCFSGDKKENLINPCQCEGTMKYVHQQCLEDWIKNRNQTISEKNSYSNKKIFSTPCEICKYQMQFTKYYKNNLLKSILKMLKNIFGSVKSLLSLTLHCFIIFYLVKRIRQLFEEINNLFKRCVNFINPTFWINFIHDLTVLSSILVAFNDIFSFYGKMFSTKRKCLIQFLPRLEK